MEYYEGEEDELNDDLREQYDGHDLDERQDWRATGHQPPLPRQQRALQWSWPSAAAEAAQETAAIAIQRLIRGVLSRTKRVAFKCLQAYRRRASCSVMLRGILTLMLTPIPSPHAFHVPHPLPSCFVLLLCSAAIARALGGS